MIGIIGAMDEEIELLKNRLENVKQYKISKMDFYVGHICGKETVISKCFEGKVNAAVCTQTMILKFKPDIILNVGLAGSMVDELSIYDIAISNKLVEFDLDATPLGYKLGHVFGLDTVYMYSDQELAEKINKIVNNYSKCIIGLIASSDKFISKEEDKIALNNEFEDVIAVDMESASISHVCMLNDTKFCAIRMISDNGSDIQFKEFLKLASDKLNEVVFHVLEQI